MSKEIRTASQYFRTWPGLAPIRVGADSRSQDMGYAAAALGHNHVTVALCQHVILKKMRHDQFIHSDIEIDSDGA